MANKVESYDASLNFDPLLEKINEIFEKKVGVSFSEEELKKLFADGERRYKEKIPPGYKDVNKSENERFGDLILWSEILNKSKSSDVDIIFISDDKKEDWWLEHQGKTISPRPELIKEFRTVTNKNCHFYRPLQFLEYSIEYLGKTIKEEVLKEVKNHVSEKEGSGKYLNVKVILKGNVEDYDAFTDDLEKAGYYVYLETGLFKDGTAHTVYISLPNIPDLIRRLNSKYLKNVSSYNLELIDVEVSEGNSRPF